MRNLVRLLAPCLLAFACVGASSPDARGVEGTRISVVVCVLPAEPQDCGPRLKVRGGRLTENWPSHARHAGVVSAKRAKIKCPPSCAAPIPGGANVDLTAQAKADPSYGTYVFDHWEGRCTARTPRCSVRVAGKGAHVKAVFRSSG